MAHPTDDLLPGHAGLLRSRDGDRAGAEQAVDSWFRSAAARGYGMCTVATPPPPGVPGVTALAPADVHPSAAPAALARRALDGGFAGLGILIRADRVIAETSRDFHDEIEAGLTDLCVEHPVSVLCVYDRPGAGVQCLDLAVGHHEGLSEQQLALRASGDTVRLSGEVDVVNLDVVDVALRTAAARRPDRLRIDLSGTTFLSAGAARLVHRHVAALRAGGALVELHGAAPQVDRVLGLVGRHLHPGGRSG
jgi:anti-anti-sigma regulatory factor